MDERNKKIKGIKVEKDNIKVFLLLVKFLSCLNLIW